jgi:predicted enzyme related to lactoylglutathione lyase
MWRTLIRRSWHTLNLENFGMISIKRGSAAPWKRRSIAVAFSSLVFSVLIGSMACAAPMQIPGIGGVATEHHPGKIIWAELATPDLAAAEHFYSGMFGWTFQSVTGVGIDYAVASSGAQPVAGILQRPLPGGDRRQPAWLTFIAVRDVDAAERIAIGNGAKSVSKPASYAGRGRQAVLADPDGAVFAVLASSNGDPPDVLAAPGEWIWSSLLAQDPDREATFYQSIFRYDLFDLPRDGGAVHVILSSDDYARASVNPLPASGHRRPHWLNFIRVVSADDAAAKAVQLGGKVLVPPFEDRHGGKVAVIADPAGAPLGVMEWSDSESKVEPK